MSEDDAGLTEEGSEAALDASFKVDSSALGDDEADFAKALGFGAEEPPPAAASPPAAAQAEPEAAPLPPATEPDTTPDATDADDPEDAPVEAPTEAQAASQDARDDAPDADPDDASIQHAPRDEMDDDDEWEAIAPRPAAEGMQDTLQSHADEVLARPDDGTPFDFTSASADASGDAVDDDRIAALENEIARSERDLAASHDRIAELEQALSAAGAAPSEGPTAEHEKDLEALRAEVDEAILERDHLIDQLAATSGELVQAQARSEQLEASLRAARGALIPLPEGERALRAEVIGLRGRLDEAAQENVRLTAEVSSVATELAIATARVEDRQHEIDFHAERAAALEQDNAEKERQLEEAVLRHREALELATRLQTENTELRSTQAALEETLQARDLEITAREEHLRVTRDGMSVREEQLVDAREALSRAQQRIESLEADLERAAIERGVLTHKIERRESRIATLTRTLGRIEDAMGQRITPPDHEAPPLARSEWTHLGGASVVTPLAPTPPPSSPPPPAPAARPVAARAAETPPLPRATPTPPPMPTPAATPEPAPMPMPTKVATPEPAMDPPPSAEAAAEYDDAPIERGASMPEATAPTRRAAPEQAPSASAADEYAFGTDDPEADETIPALVPPPPLPTILSRWRDRQVRDLDDAIEGVGALLADQLLARLYDPPPEAIYLRSLGGSLPDAEVRWVQALQARGVEGVRMDVLDPNEANADARRQHIERAGLGDVIRVEVGDLDAWDTEAPCHGILLADVLHAQRDVTTVFDHLATQTARGALLFFVGRIGAGPVQLSASTLMRLEELWQLMPDSLAQAEGLGRPPYRGDDGGSPAPAQDASEALRRRFAPLALVGFGHLTDLVVGPARGFALSDDDADALRLLDAVGAIDQSRTETESLPPRHGIGVFAHDAADPAEVFGRPWAPLTDG